MTPMTSLRLRIELRDVVPAVWREVTVPADLPLPDVHEVIQASMGWENAHLHAFASGGGEHWSSSPRWELSDPEGPEGALPEERASLKDVAGAVGDRFTYLYDFGDNWEHLVTVIATHEDDGETPSAPPVALLDGAGPCPPEDCGGVPGFESLIGWIADLEAGRPLDDWAQESLQWLAGSLDADALRRALMYDPVAAAERVRIVSMPLPALRPDLAALLARDPGGRNGALHAMVVQADLGAAAALDDAQCAALTDNLRWFLDLVGTDGLPLTPAGYLKPAVAQQVAARLGLQHEWIGTMRREDQTWPVLAFRESTTLLGLTRKLKGTLRLSRTGAALADDPRGLVAHLVQRLPLGRVRFDQEGGLVLLLALAGREPEGDDDGDGDSERQDLDAALDRAGEALTSLGWSLDGAPIPSGTLLREVAATTAVLEQSGIVTSRRAIRGGLRPTEAGQAFLRLVLTGAEAAVRP